MAIINLGSIKFNWKGAYDGATSYTIDDVVSSGGNSYVCIAATTGNTPPNASYWELMAQAGTDGTDLTTTLTTQGDIVYRDASGLARLGAGSAGQALITNGTGANPSWGDVSGGTSWQSSIKTSAFTAVAGEGYWINTTSAAVTVTLPASASVGDTIEFSDYAGTWGTNAVTLNTNSLNFQGNTSPNPVYNTNNQSVTIVYSGATQGWIPTSDDDVSIETPQFITAEYLVVAGGGGGGQSYEKGGGGGGAGGYRNSYSTETSGGGGSTETPAQLIQGETYTITVGAGGAINSDGEDSSIIGNGVSIISFGGCASAPFGDGVGGSGGGGTGYGNSFGVGGSKGTTGQGYDGGRYLGLSQSAGGGGGGAGEAGNTDGSSQGGDGLSSSITGSAVTRAGGGAGGYDSGGSQPGGTGGGGNGAYQDTNTAANAGSTNTGGGGGGGGFNASAAAGGSGVVILRIATADYSGTTTGSPTVSTDGTDTVLVYNSSGTYTA